MPADTCARVLSPGRTGLLSSNPQRIERFFEEVTAGTIWINTPSPTTTRGRPPVLLHSRFLQHPNRDSAWRAV